MHDVAFKLFLEFLEVGEREPDWLMGPCLELYEDEGELLEIFSGFPNFFLEGKHLIHHALGFHADMGCFLSLSADTGFKRFKPLRNLSEHL